MNRHQYMTGVSVAIFLFAMLLMLKLAATINWSWWMITAPLWGFHTVAMVTHFVKGPR